MISQSQSGENDSAFAEELKLIPRWSIVAAAALFVFMQYLSWVILPAHKLKPSTAPFGLRFYFALSWSTLSALYMLMTGYVSRDAPRRNMSTRLWVIICLALPGGIGAVLYFLLRLPVVALCPSCGTSIHAEFHFCPQCAYQVSAACGNCYRGVRITDVYCVHCGHSLASDNMPARLRAFQS
ncbi:MAG: zinc ribbon domain-containing protein [Acidobacteriaceae bacterium]